MDPESENSGRFRNFGAESPSHVRYGVLTFLCVLSFVLYLDRICIGQAVVPMQNDLHISSDKMGYVLAAFTLAYGLFEVPTGRWGDRFGSRRVLTRIVLWWSVFTALTGAAQGFVILLLVRFLFGAGEAGALPNACRVIARWFPPARRGTAQGFIVTAAQVGGVAAPVITVYSMEAIGWRWTFVLFGLLGVFWAAGFYFWFRDNPAEHRNVNGAELELLTENNFAVAGLLDHPPVPWRKVLLSATVWLMGAIMACSAAVAYMYFSWYPKYLQEARGVPPVESGWMSGLVLAGGAVGGVCGGYLGDWLLGLTGNRRWTRSGTGCLMFFLAALALVAAVRTDSPWLAAGWTALANLLAQVQLAAWWAVVTDISGKHVGTMFGLMNSMGVPGAVFSQVFLGHFTEWMQFQGYDGRQCWDPVFYLFAVTFVIGAACWLFVDSDKTIASENATSAPGQHDFS